MSSGDWRSPVSGFMHMYLPVMSSVACFTGSALYNRNIHVNAKSHFDALNIITTFV